MTEYLSNCCIPVSQVASRRYLRSAARHQLTVSRHRLSTYGQRAFAVAGPTMFNTLPDDPRDPAVSTSTFRQSLKTIFSLTISTFSALGVSHVMRSINVRYLLTFTYLQRTVYPHKWSLVSCRSSTEQGKFAGQRPTFYR